MNTLYLPELREMLAADDQGGLREFCAALHPARVAEFMEGLEPDETWIVIQAAPDELTVDIFNFLEPAVQVAIVESRGAEEMSPLVAELPADDRVDLLNEIDDAVYQQVVPLLPQEDRREVLRLREYPEGTAGSVMTTEVARLSAGLTVREALEEISRQSEDLETIYYNYVVDNENRLLGLLSARQLVTHFRQGEMPIDDLMQRDVVSVLATDDREAVAAKVADFDFLAIPVIDDGRRLLGIITHDDIIDVLREEAIEDAHLGAAIDPLQEGYLETPWYTLAWKRGVWLAVLFVAALLTAFALRSYESDFQKVSWLVLFIPLVISSGGNSGSQSATLVITGMTNGDVELADWWRVIRRELLMGLCLGAALAVVGYFCAFGMTRAAPDTGTDAAYLAPTLVQVLVVPITLLLVVVCGTLVGGALPLVFRRLGLDPALMSNPFVAGIIDIAGIVIYMTVAVAMIGELRS
ncbi:MAG: magnesium transporter [Planctomycetota bacterium]